MSKMIGQIGKKDLVGFSRWRSSGGDAGTAYLDVLARSGGNLTVTIQHKNLDQADSAATDAANTISATTTGVFSARNTGHKQLVRLKFTVTGTNATDWILFRSLGIVWEPN